MNLEYMYVLQGVEDEWESVISITLYLCLKI